MEKQTAVEWLKKELIKRFNRSQTHYTDSEWCFDMIKDAEDLELYKKQTAVEWLIEMTSKLGYVSSDIAEQAKEMHKQEIIDAFVECWKANMPDGYECKLSAEQYYNETFGK